MKLDILSVLLVGGLIAGLLLYINTIPPQNRPTEHKKELHFQPWAFFPPSSK